MSSYRFTPQAVDDLFEIWSYIAVESVEAANRMEYAIHLTSAFLADHPLVGRARKDLTELPVRFWLVPHYTNYWMVYDPHTNPLQVIRILHASRDIRQLLK